MPAPLTQFLGRRSWDTELLEVQSDLGSGTLRSPSKTMAVHPLSPLKSGTASSIGSTRIMRIPSKFAPEAASMSRQEALDDVERMLDANIPQRRLRHRSLDSNPLPLAPYPSPTNVKTNRKAPSFAFAPLQDPVILAAQEDVEDDLLGKQTDREDYAASDANRNGKYFGQAAKVAYYKTYQELHARAHLFVDSSTLNHGSRKPRAIASNASRRNATPGLLLPVRSPSRPDSIVIAPVPAEDIRHGDQDAIGSPSIGLIPTTPIGKSTMSRPSLHSPRVVFLASCIAQSHPAASLVLRKDDCHAFDFSYQGLGDAFLLQFAACLPDLPLVESINVRDNRLSDHALNALLCALENKPQLTYLDISENEVGKQSVKSLRNYIASSLCTLKTLVVNQADVDDQECARFMIAFEQNKSVQRLFLRSNRIGQAVVTGSRDAGPLCSGGEAIGSMLNVNLNIQELDLSWNVLRFANSTPIAKSLELNYNLKELNVSYNACGDQGAMAFGHALRVNSALETLNLAYNSIAAKGVLVLASGLAANKSLQRLVLDGNHLGLEGGRAVMRGACTRPGGIRSLCQLSLVDCHLIAPHNGSTGNNGVFEVAPFNADDPVGSYHLDLADPYDQMIAHELLRLATFHPGYRFSSLEHFPPGIKTGGTKIELSRLKVKVRKTLKKTGRRGSILEKLFAQLDKDKSGSIDQSELIVALQNQGMHISEDQVAVLLKDFDYDHNGVLQEDEFQDFFVRCGFSMIDTDHSGSLDRNEINQVLKLMGFSDVSEEIIDSMITQYDLNHSGEIDEQEFLQFMKHQLLPSAGISDTSPRNEGQSVHGHLPLCGSSGAVWKIPSSGMLVVDFVFDGVLKEEEEETKINEQVSGESPNARRRAAALKHEAAVVSDAIIATLLTNVQTVSSDTTEQMEFLSNALDDFELRFTAVQAEMLLIKQGAMKSSARKLRALVRIIPQMIDRRETINLLNRLIEPSQQWTQRLVLKKHLGSNLYAVLLGALTNKYVLDLNLPADRDALKRIALLAQEEKQFSKNRAGRGDTSQHGNWENYRHATVDQTPMLLTSTYILNTLLAPTKAKSQQPVVSFHYVSTTRPPRGMHVLSNRRFEQFIQVWDYATQEVSVSSVAHLDQTDGEESLRRENARQHWELLRIHVFNTRKNQPLTQLRNVYDVKKTLDLIEDRLLTLEMLLNERWLSSDQAKRLIFSVPDAAHARGKAACLVFSRIVDLENFMSVR